MCLCAKCRLMTVILCAGLCACGPARKVESVRSGAYVPGLALAEDARTPEIPVDDILNDTLMVKDADGRDLIIMKAVRDENGDMVASDVIVPSVVVGSFRNVAEASSSAMVTSGTKPPLKRSSIVRALETRLPRSFASSAL